MSFNDDYVAFPLVSIIISNYNYERYLGQAIKSSFGQEYPNIEVIVVDDVSTDNSIVVAKKALGNRPNCRIIKRVVNGGQGPALLDGLRISSGEFVTFLDADDVLFPNFAATHVYTHLALPWQVAFTSSHLVHLGPTGRLITATSGCIRNTILSAPPAQDVQLSPLQIVHHIDNFLNEFARCVARCIYLPSERAGYHWSSSSGLMFKRAAIEQIAFEELIRRVRLSADFYFTLSHLFNGSAVIDAKLGGYRIHDKNLYSNAVHLERTNSSRHSDKDLFLNILGEFTRCVTRSRLQQCSQLLAQFYPQFLRTLQDYVNQHSGDSQLVGQAIVDNYDHFSKIMGEERASKILESLGVSSDEIVTFPTNLVLRK